MSTRTENLAAKFDATYPEELSARLYWWRRTLGIDQTRLLRMIGMSADQARRKKGVELKDILERVEWRENAQLVEGCFHRLLALFNYDVRTLAERIHQPVKGRGEQEPSRLRRRSAEVPRLRYAPNGDPSEKLLINGLAEGGPQFFFGLLTRFAGSQADEGHAG